MGIIRIVATDWISQQVECAARREGRSVSAMGLRLLTESLDIRKKSSAEIDSLVAALRAKSPT
jgi:hypothetical protein